MKSGIERSLVNRPIIITAFVILIAICCGFYAAFGQPPEELFKNANELYKSNQYQQAAENYEKILGQGYHKPEVYYNLGNCYYKLNMVGKSVLYFERSLKLSPKDEDIQHNLKLAQLKVSDKIEPVPQLLIFKLWNDFISLNSSKGWGLFCLGAVWLAVLVFALSLFVRNRRTFNVVSLFLVLLSIVFLSLAIHQNRTESHSKAAILMIPSSYVKSAPDSNANDLFVIHEGVKLEIVDQVGNWNKIRLADGKVGWIEWGTFEMI